jgi:transposase InsO family protein
MVALTEPAVDHHIAEAGDRNSATRQRPLVHSGQGFQYQHRSWRAMLDDADASQSMSCKANCYDNTLAENFFGHLKAELFHHNRFDIVEAFTTALDDYIHWYNNHRISTKLNGLSPVQYRAQALRLKLPTSGSNFRDHFNPLGLFRWRTCTDCERSMLIVNR